MKDLSVINKFFFFLNLAAIVALLFSYLAYYISPLTFWPIAFFSLAAPPLLIINFFFLVFWLFQWKKQFWFSTLSLLIGFKIIAQTITFNIPQPAPDNSDSTTLIKIFSYNVRLFDLYEWINKEGSKDKILELIKSETPDILCFQEYYHSSGNKPFISTKEICNSIKLPFAHVENTSTLRKTEHWGIATFSKFPIVKKEVIQFGEKKNNICIYTDIKLNNDTLRVFNLHMASIGFASEDYRFLDDLIHQKETDEIEGTKGILKRLKRAFVKRTKQAEIVAQHINASPYKVIVCGDFNDTPSSFSYKKVKENLSDAFCISGNGFGQSYIGKFPSYRIDYILHSKELQSYEFITHPDKLSDHYPISCFLEVKRR